MTTQSAVARARKAGWSPSVVAQWPDEPAVPTDNCCSAR